MSERINISIPGELHERLSHFKDRLNMSKICQEAINHAVRLEEIKEAAIPDIDDLLDRLKEEELQYGEKYIGEGFEWGIKDAYGLSLNEFLEIEFCHRTELSGEITDGSYEEMFSPSEATIKAFEKFKERTNADSDERSETMDKAFGVATMLDPNKFFIRGWLNGVSHIWDEVKSELLGYNESGLN